MRVLLALAPLLLIVSCVPEGQPRLHEVVLYGAENSRLTYFYGTPTTLLLGEEEIALERLDGEGDDPLLVSQALSVAAEPYLRESVAPLQEAPVEVVSVARSSDLRVAVNEDTGPVLYFDGSMWFTLIGDGRAGMDMRVVPRPRIGGLSGLGELTREEAQAIQEYLEAEGPVAVTVLDRVPASPRVADGTSEYLRTALYLQRDFATTAAPPRREQEELVWEEMADGNNAVGVEDETYYLVRTEEALRTLWNRAYGSRLQVPDVPEVNFSRETVVALFMGSRPTGGYSLEVESVTIEGGEVYVDVNRIEPGPDEITTQALTSPWTMIRILRGGLSTIWVREAGTDRLLGTASSVQ